MQTIKKLLNVLEKSKLIITLTNQILVVICDKCVRIVTLRIFVVLQQSTCLNE